MPKDTTFEKTMEAMGKMSPDEMKAKMAELTKICMCGKCPSYKGTGETKLLFCLTGKAELSKKRKAAYVLPVLLLKKLVLDGYIIAPKVLAKSRLACKSTLKFLSLIPHDSAS